MSKTKFRKHDWLNTKEISIKYGIQAKTETISWSHCCDGGKPLIYDSEEERDKKLKELRKAERKI